MRIEWKNLGDTIEGFPCVTLVGEGVNRKSQDKELCLAGELGEIWENGPGKYKACIVLRGRRDEKIFSFDSKDLKKVKTQLRVPFRADDQVALANSPSKRLK